MIPPSLQEFYIKTKGDPLFAAEGMDLENASAAIGELYQTTSRLEKLYRETKKEYWFHFRHSFLKTLHPFNFLRSFIECEKRRRIFLAEPSAASARRLINSYWHALASWEGDVSSYKKAHLAFIRMERLERSNPEYIYNKYSVNLSDVLKSIDLLAENGKILRAEILFRLQLLLNSAIASKKDNVKVDQDLLETVPRMDYIPFELVGPKLTAESDFILSLEEDVMPSILERYGPIYYTLSHFDGRPKNHQFYLYILKSPEADKKFLRITLADEYFFLEIDPAKYKFHEGISIYEPLIKRGIRFWHQSATTFYSVRDFTYQADLASIADLHWRRKFLDKFLVLSQKSSLLDLFFWNGVIHEQTFLRMAKIEAASGVLNPLSYVFIVRSYPSLFFLPFNRSVWRLEERPNFVGSRFAGGSIYKTLDDIRKDVGKEDLREIFLGPSYRAKDWGELFVVE
ncbi:hypothetical protein A3I27_04695 [Candidatus Giovannonibacteria bacterium RIFCSPLOWO2_02_FULL_43_11b]|uniref:Uncharacterized protein n=1 Tax=Candidatus Giovannonibacteria bacterium RIFCSPHIGHO2_12_FULL_43_15 TaxID=1798341 RepID=A0A1F5WRP5_9BACT|nr:MAG: hypothetical protein A2739_02435 [Candidatus Giovannonibacteria bacterium RIFCSPHIGHO2_01_FULL_43_100]OGF67264.1 MAG: hypothetical protein A3B97_00430 [Candidatus Giovannonibacteria bacterium RIFCSPHIGHO2_02_FULL_43_32]OGF78257.1 MAG: hypothetical protein A3F23_02390 [Candidatus Giovannonibacteria bacterium RIFCSPHIGHO2_12_FULL_43_15]OGF78762.1 MAG: hypothetical protein A3A15_00880 [Candidatus Giovannonibacteria bacterium RIFCSPLOWO2_01_FULL_43_60]OGF90324.1 MAG: hypothetical protein A3